MIDLALDLISKLDESEMEELSIIPWAAPVPVFGELSTAKLATLGLNPSNKEFVDDHGKELSESKRRFQTLKALGLVSWADVKRSDIEKILYYCTTYFSRNPYDGWFKRLDYLISGSTVSYYFPSANACHLDLVPFATYEKWGNLSPYQRTKILDKYSHYLGEIINSSDIKIIVLNGKSVIDNFQRISDVILSSEIVEDWTLTRDSGNDVYGVRFIGECKTIGGICLNKPVKVLGFNYNIQSSFGITSKVQESIRKWISSEVLNESE